MEIWLSVGIIGIILIGVLIWTFVSKKIKRTKILEESGLNKEEVDKLMPEINNIIRENKTKIKSILIPEHHYNRRYKEIISSRRIKDMFEVESDGKIKMNSELYDYLNNTEIDYKSQNERKRIYEDLKQFIDRINSYNSDYIIKVFNRGDSSSRDIEYHFKKRFEKSYDKSFIFDIKTSSDKIEENILKNYLIQIHNFYTEINRFAENNNLPKSVVKKLFFEYN